ncbi:hypothetical protein [Actinomadura harenae]|uniref:Uncharacterized protein n=1 Tax=Actinomadura harenae TaxID=2483351 RepID=A0A3M2LK53_9ACTN|nr:hypothetical protein [Actinomadura harenae]RMI37867.1 hypothetical protein EBO15_34615 [Actinomadura harenae]
MKLATFALAAGLAAGPLLATPAHAETASGPWTYQCVEGAPAPFGPTSIIAHGCEALKGAPVKEVLKEGRFPAGRLRLVVRHFGENEPKVVRCEEMNLKHFPRLIDARGCARDDLR